MSRLLTCSPANWRRALLDCRPLAAAPPAPARSRVRPPLLRHRLAPHPPAATPHLRIVRALLPGLRSPACLRVGPGRATRAETVTALRRLGTARSLRADLLAHHDQGGDMIRQFGADAGSEGEC